MEFTFENQPVSQSFGGAKESILAVTDKLLASIRQQLQRQIDSLPSKDVVLKAAGEAYDKFIAPLDIPGVPPLMEPWVDQMLKAVFLRLVSAMYDQLQAL